MFQHLVSKETRNVEQSTMKGSPESPMPRLPMLRKKAESFVEASSGQSPFLRLANLVEKTTTQAAKLNINEPEDDEASPLPNLPLLNRTLSKESESDHGALIISSNTFNPHAVIITAPPIEAIKFSENDKIPSNRVGDGMWSSSCWSSNDQIAHPKVDESAMTMLSRGSTYQQRKKKRRDSWDTSPPESPLGDGLVKETSAALALRVRRWLLKKGVPGVPSFDERFWASWSPSILRVTPLHEVLFPCCCYYCCIMIFIVLLDPRYHVSSPKHFSSIGCF